MKLSVSTILSVFRLLIWLLAKREETLNKRYTKADNRINALITKKNIASEERCHAQRAQEKLRDFVI